MAHASLIRMGSSVAALLALAGSVPVASGDEAARPYRVPLLPAASDPEGRVGLVRIINHSGEAGTVRIGAFDDAGTEYCPLRLALGAHEAVQLSSEDLETGNPDKRLEGAAGAGKGDWRFEVESALDLEVLSYVRRAEGPLSALHDVVPRSEAGIHRVVFFNPGSNRRQASRLRLINPGAEAAEVAIAGTDDAGAGGEEMVTLTLPAHASRTVTAAELEAGDAERLDGALGDGTGKWRLRVTSDQPIGVMSLLLSLGGDLTNVSTVPVAAGGDEEARLHRVSLLPSGSDPEGRGGVVRVINHSPEAGTVRIAVFDDTGAEYGPVTLSVGANEAVQLSSGDLETGNPDKGLSGAAGVGEGDWRLELESVLDMEVLSYARRMEGPLSALHDLVPTSEDGAHRVAFFNPASATGGESRLRLVNPGAEAAEIAIAGTDDAGEAGESVVTLTVPAHASRTVSATELEAGDARGLAGGLGDGTGKWRLRVSADQPIGVMSLLSSPGGDLTNVSTAPGAAEPGGEEAPHRAPLLPSGSDPEGREGVVRVINHSPEAGTVRIAAFDDTGTESCPLRLALGAGEAVQLSSGDLETGNPDKGLEDGTGPSEGDRRLTLESALDIEVLSYVRTPGGPLSALHDVAPRSEDGAHRVAFFGPGRGAGRESRVRLTSTGTRSTTLHIRGTDDAGEAGESVVGLTLAPGASRALGAADLESGEAEGLTGALGHGEGHWRLRVSADRPIRVMSLRSGPGGHLANLSTAPRGDAAHQVPLLLSASDPEREGFVRAINHSPEAGTVRITAFDDAGTEYGPLTLAMGAGESVSFSSRDLEAGNPDKGLEGDTGPGEGDWRLEFESTLDLEVLSYLRQPDGSLSALHDVVPRVGRRHWVALFNPGSNRNRTSRLRLVNPGGEAAAVTIRGIDDAGASPDSGVEVVVPAGVARTFSAAELESGDAEGLDGALGNGAGKWRLLVESDEAVLVMHLLGSPAGHLTNLSTAPGRGAAAGAHAVRRVAENAPAGIPVGAPVTMAWGEGGTRMHTLAGPNAGAFTIDARTGQLRTRAEVAYDHETRSAYPLTVRVRDGSDAEAHLSVVVEVIDVTEPPGRPAAPEVRGRSSTSLEVSWNAPENSGPAISGYEVEYRPEGAEEYIDADHTGERTEVQIEGLQPNTAYEARVRASNPEGLGPWSEAGSGRTLGRRPLPPPPPPSPPPLQGSVRLDKIEIFQGPLLVRRKKLVAPGGRVSFQTTSHVDFVKGRKTWLSATLLHKYLPYDYHDPVAVVVSARVGSGPPVAINPSVELTRDLLGYGGVYEPGLFETDLVYTLPDTVVGDTTTLDVHLRNAPAGHVPLPAIDLGDFTFRTIDPITIRFFRFENNAGTPAPITQGIAATFVNWLQMIHPVASVNTVIEGDAIPMADIPEWNVYKALHYLNTLWVENGTNTEYYYGFIKNTEGNPFGSALIGGPVSVGLAIRHQWSPYFTFVHELGHNFNRRHASCGFPQPDDPHYPYGVSLGPNRGWHSIASRFADSSTHRGDVMGYCEPFFISDYTYKAVLDYLERRQKGSRARTGTAKAVEDVKGSHTAYTADRERAASIALAGSIGASGVWTLEMQSYSSREPLPPQADGRYTLKLLDSQGRMLLSERIRAFALSHAAGRAWGIRAGLPSEKATEIVIYDEAGRVVLREAFDP